MANLNWDAPNIICAIGAGVGVAVGVTGVCVAVSAKKDIKRLGAEVSDISGRVERLEYVTGFGPGSRLVPGEDVRC